MSKVSFSSIFSQKALGISFHGNDLIMTYIWKRLIRCSHETFKIRDFMVKDVQQLKSASISWKKPEGEVILSWPRENAILREIDCPHSNFRELKDALEYQMDSFIPFNNEEVYFDIYPVPHINNDKKVILVAVKKRELDDVMAKLHSLRIYPSRVIISSFAFLPVLGAEKGSVVLISKDTRYYAYNLYESNQLVLSSIVKTGEELANKVLTHYPQEVIAQDIEDTRLLEEYAIPCRVMEEYAESYGAAHYGLSDYHCSLNLIKSGRGRLNPQQVVLSVLLCALVFFAFYVPHIRKVNNQEAVLTIQSRIKSLRNSVKAVERLQERAEVLDVVVRKINEMEGNYIPRIDVILELARILPGDAWTKGITIQQNTFEIEGDAVSSTNLIPTLENSPLFSGVGLTSPVTRIQSGREKFQIRGKIERQ